VTPASAVNSADARPDEPECSALGAGLRVTCTAVGDPVGSGRHRAPESHRLTPAHHGVHARHRAIRPHELAPSPRPETSGDSRDSLGDPDRRQAPARPALGPGTDPVASPPSTDHRPDTRTPRRISLSVVGRHRTGLADRDMAVPDPRQPNHPSGPGSVGRGANRGQRRWQPLRQLGRQLTRPETRSRKIVFRQRLQLRWLERAQAGGQTIKFPLQRIELGQLIGAEISKARPRREYRSSEQRDAETGATGSQPQCRTPERSDTEAGAAAGQRQRHTPEHRGPETGQARPGRGDRTPDHMRNHRWSVWRRAEDRPGDRQLDRPPDHRGTETGPTHNKCRGRLGVRRGRPGV
jgi:hypothetical protein